MVYCKECKHRIKQKDLSNFVYYTCEILDDQATVVDGDDCCVTLGFLSEDKFSCIYGEKDE